MAHFLGEVMGQRGKASRLGSKQSGLRVTAASWAGAIRVELYVNADGRDSFRVVQDTWHGAGVSEVLAVGVLGVRVGRV